MNPMAMVWEEYIDTSLALEIERGVVARGEIEKRLAELHFKMGFVAASVVMAQASQTDEEYYDKVARDMAEGVSKFLNEGYEAIFLEIEADRKKGELTRVDQT